jgi:ATP-dependent DNA helicase RecQ
LDYLIGHNLVAFDAVHLAAANPRLQILKLPFVDTLQLNPLAFPRNPYHHLVKHYHDGQLKRVQLNDPKLDAQLTLEVLRDQYEALGALRQSDPELLLAWHWLITRDGDQGGVEALFTELRQQQRPSRRDATAAVTTRFGGQVCSTHLAEILESIEAPNWPMAYALAWLSVAGGNSVMPPWVRKQFPESGRIVRLLRDTACSDPACTWCRTQHDARAQLKRWFGFDDFRPEPVDSEGRPLQAAIVEAAMAGQHVLGLLPTGTGKSICYQIPALSRYDKTGAITVVISPLVALMTDQIEGLERQGISNCAALNGLLSMPERADVLDRVRLGDVSVLIISPEQLRSRALRRVLEQRQIGGWVLDEAHCLSKWGHDFRPDYRYIGRYIRERAGDEPIPPVLCLTATAKPEVVEDIVGHFRDRLGIELVVYNGGSSRDNLDFAVVATTPAEKFAHVCQVIEHDLPGDTPGGAIVYCATRRTTEELAGFLKAKGISAGHFHAGLPPETKKSVQRQFIDGELKVIAATNAFGMGIDKPDVRLVIHADIPGSLENYLQEAGRAGRDRAAARCVLLFSPEDVERQFGMSARSRLKQREINAILRSLRRLDRKKRFGGEVVATAGEILTEEEEGQFARDSATDDTRVRTAVAWLEEAKLVARDENRVSIFPSSLRVANRDQARDRLTKRKVAEPYASQLLTIVDALIQADPDEGVSTDELMGLSGLSSQGVVKALHDLEAIGVASNDTALTAFVHAGVERSSVNRLEDAMLLEQALIEKLQEAAPDLSKGDASMLHLRQMTQALLDDGMKTALPVRLRRILKGLSKDGQGEDSGRGSVSLRSIDRETVQITLLRDWPALAKTAELRRKAAQALLDKLLEKLPAGARGVDLLAETTFGELRATLSEDMFLKAEVRDFDRLMEHALLWLHEQEVIRINKGLVVFRPAMTIRLDDRGGSFLKADFEPLQQHYNEQVVQIHVMAEYARRGLEAQAEALRLTMDYFTLPRAEFIGKWLADREKELYRQTLPETWKAIVDCLGNPIQQRIVADDRERTNVLVLAGPGSGKTRVLVHRIAYLVRVKRENPRGILALAYNRHAAVEIRERLAALIGDDAKWVTVLTCHAMAMRLTGHSFAGKRLKLEDDSFAQVIKEAVGLLRGEGLPPEEADEQRERLLAGFRWILVDEYQDVEAEQYELISALAGRKRPDEDGRLSLFAVGDDDQNIYSFAGASVEFIRRFEEDYLAKPAYLTDNYRSTNHIISAANLVIEPAHSRMKEHSPIRIDRRRESQPPGGLLSSYDPLASGRVQVLSVGETPVEQAIGVMTELRRLAALVPNWNWAKTAVIARNWNLLDPVRSYCELHGIPVQSAAEERGSFWRFRETQALVDALRGSDRKLLDAGILRRWLKTRPAGPHWDALRGAVEEYGLETGEQELPVGHFFEWLAEWCRDVRIKQTGLLLLSAHRAKGLEFDHVAVLDGNWNGSSGREDPDAPRRLYYVAMTRARQSLLLARMTGRNRLLDELPSHPSLLNRSSSAPEEIPVEMYRRHMRLSLSEVDLSFAGRYGTGHAVHQAHQRLSVGDPLELCERDGRWELLDTKGQPVCRLAKAFSPPQDMRCVDAKVAAVAVRFEEDSEPEYREYLRCSRWEVVVPELVFEPFASGVNGGKTTVDELTIGRDSEIS